LRNQTLFWAVPTLRCVALVLINSWKIPFPADGAVVVPDVIISPVVGFDPHNFRLGYGGGFFDRTLAAMTEMPLLLGVGYSMAALSTIHPRPHDIPMSAIITEHGTA